MSLENFQKEGPNSPGADQTRAALQNDATNSKPTKSTKGNDSYDGTNCMPSWDGKPINCLPVPDQVIPLISNDLIPIGKSDVPEVERASLNTPEKTDKRNQVQLPTGDYLTQELAAYTKPMMVMPNGESLHLQGDYWSLQRADGSTIITETEAARQLDHKLNKEMQLDDGAKLRCEGNTWSLNYANGDQVSMYPLRIAPEPITLKDGTPASPTALTWSNCEVMISRDNGKSQAKFIAAGPEVLIATPLYPGY